MASAIFMLEQGLADPFQIPVGIAGLPAVSADYCSAMPFVQPPGSAGAEAAGLPHAHQWAIRRAAICIATRDMVACGSAVPAATRVTVVSVCLLAQRVGNVLPASVAYVVVTDLARVH